MHSVNTSIIIYIHFGGGVGICKSIVRTSLTTVNELLPSSTAVDVKVNTPSMNSENCCALQSHSVSLSTSV